MSVKQIDPLQDPRWGCFVESHPRATIFHTQGWLEALRRTYDYQPIVLTTAAGDEPLENGLVLCKVSSWLTGARLVSLPFSDHCQPLVNDRAVLDAFLRYLEEQVQNRAYKYAEIRPLTAFGPGSATHASTDDSFCIHMLDLRPSVEALFKDFHKNHIQRKLSRARKEDLTIEEGRSEKLLRDFFRLMLLTRRRHCLPPQPLDWFRNLTECLGEQATIRVAYRNRIPVASIFTLSCKKTMVYKYGCSDPAFNSLGGTTHLFWHAMQEAKNQGLEQFDFGRSEVENDGLVHFKDNWGSARLPLRYYRYASRLQSKPAPIKKAWHVDLAERALSRLPDSCLVLAGKLLYRHVG